MTSEATVRLDRLTFAYGQQPVLTGIDLSMAEGEIYGLVGADGAGKSTLLRLVMGQLLPNEGSVTVLGQAATQADLRTQVAYLPQGFGLYPDLSVQENLAFFADLHGLKRPVASQRRSELLQRTGLHGFEDRRAGALSGGMMQKLALACALISRPRVMVLDEPTTGVDPVSRRAFWRLLDGVRVAGVTILYATANLDEAERCDRVGLLRDGRLHRQGTPLALATAPMATLVGVSGADARHWRHEVARLPGVSLVFPLGRQLRVWLETGRSWSDFQTDLQQRAPTLTVQPLQPTLQDATLRELALADAAGNQTGLSLIGCSGTTYSGF